MMGKQKTIIHIAVHMGGGVGKAISGLICETDRERWTHLIVLLEEPADNRYVVCCQEAGITIILANETEKEHIIRLLSDADAIILNWWGHPLMPKFIIEHLTNITGRWIFWFHINGCSYPYIPYELPADSSAALFTTSYSLENPLWAESKRRLIKEKSALIYGIGAFLPSAICPKKHYHTDRLRIGYAGTVSYSKMDRHILEYIRIIQNHIPDVEVTLVGECDEEIRKEISANNMDSFVTCTGRLANIYPYYESFDIFLYLLNPENYGTTENVLLEAMAVGLPIIVWNNPVERNVIKHGQNGFIAEGKEQLLELVSMLGSDEEMRRTAGSKAREYVCRKYDADVNRQAYLHVLLRQCEKLKVKYPFEKNIGTSPYEWFQRFTGRNREKFTQLSCGNWMPGEALAPIYTGKHKSSIYHFLEYYPEDQRLQQISAQIDRIKESSKGQTNGECDSK